MTNRMGSHIHALCVSRVDRASDAELLRRFAADEDEAAFRSLVDRYGSMVRGVCSRMLPGADADDVFQGTFLALARQSASIRHGTVLGGWLSGVAYRLALQVRRQAARRRRHERTAASEECFTEQVADPAWRELRAVLDEELQALAGRYRGPLVACYLQGLTQDEAARQLGWSLGTLRRRLKRGRELLRCRLTRRGATLGASLLASAVVAAPGRAAVSAQWPLAPVRAAVGVGQTELAKSVLTKAVVPAIGWIGRTRLVAAALFVALSVGVAVSIGMVVAKGAPDAAGALPMAPAEALLDAAAPPDAAATLRLDRYGDALPPDALARLGTTRLQAGNGVYLIADLPGGKELFTIGSVERSATLCWWSSATGKFLRRGQSAIEIVRNVALSPVARTVVLVGYDRARQLNRVLLYDAATGARTQELELAGKQVDAVAFMSDGKTLATSEEDQTVRLWDVKTGREVRQLLAGKGRLNRMVISPDGKLLAAAALGQPVQLWDVATGKERSLAARRATLGDIFCFSPDSGTLAVAAQGHPTILLWDLEKDREKKQLLSEGGTAALAFSPDGRTLASAGARVEQKVLTRSPIRLWEASSGKEIRRLPGHLYGVDALAFTRDGKRLISGGTGTTLRVWDMANGKDVFSFPEHESYVNCVAYSPDGKTLATSGLDGTIRLWEPGSNRPALVFPEGHRQRVWSVAYSADGRELVSWGHDRTVRFWNVAERREVRKFAVAGEARGVNVVPSPDGRQVALWTKDGGLRLVDSATGKERRRLDCDSGEFVGLRFSPDGRQLAILTKPTATGATEARLWDVATGKEVSKWDLESASPAQFIFSPDGRMLVGVDMQLLLIGAAKRALWVRDLAARKVRTYAVPVQARIFSLAWSPDGRVLALGSAEGEVVLVELASGQVRRRMAGHRTYVQSLAFSPDGKTLASGSADATALVWDVIGAADKRPRPLTEPRLSALWEDLASADAEKAEVALRALAADSARSVRFMKERIRPIGNVDAKTVERLVAALDNDEYAQRQKAMEDLRRLGEGTEPALRKALLGKLPLESHKRVEKLVQELESNRTSSAGLRVLRAVEALERAGTPEARGLLRELSDGARGARLTEEARESLQRLIGTRGTN